MSSINNSLFWLLQGALHLVLSWTNVGWADFLGWSLSFEWAHVLCTASVILFYFPVIFGIEHGFQRKGTPVVYTLTAR
jgi:hypothetical protein